MKKSFIAIMLALASNTIYTAPYDGIDEILNKVGVWMVTVPDDLDETPCDILAMSKEHLDSLQQYLCPSLKIEIPQNIIIWHESGDLAFEADQCEVKRNYLRHMFLSKDPNTNSDFKKLHDRAKEIYLNDNPGVKNANLSFVTLETCNIQLEILECVKWILKTVDTIILHEKDFFKSVKRFGFYDPDYEDEYAEGSEPFDGRGSAMSETYTGENKLPEPTSLTLAQLTQVDPSAFSGY